MLLVTKLDGIKGCVNPLLTIVQNTKESQAIGNLDVKTGGMITIIVKVTLQKQDNMLKDTKLVGQKAIVSKSKA
jgi:hypothetical protein